MSSPNRPGERKTGADSSLPPEGEDGADLGRQANPDGGAGSGDDPSSDPDAEYELEPVDSSILDAERTRTSAEIRRASVAVDINQAYEQETADPVHLPEDGFQFRFQLKHVLVGTSLLAVFFSLAKLLGVIAAVVTLLMLLLVTAHLYIAWQERRREEELLNKRRADRIRARGVEEGLSDAQIEAEILDELGEDEAPVEPFRWQFSMTQLVIAMTASALLVGLIRLIGADALVKAVAAVFGGIAIVGLVANVLGYEPPPKVAVAWWIVLLGYVLFCIVTPALGLSG